MKLEKEWSEDTKEFLPLLTVDPGIGGTGWAYWSLAGELRPFMSGVIRGHGILETTMNFNMVICSVPPLKTLVVEGQEVRQDAISQKATASRSLFKLAWLTGAIMASWAPHTGAIYTVLPSHWKGQLTKEAVKTRIKVLTGLDAREHEADAIGIGLAIAGVLSDDGSRQVASKMEQL